MNTRTLYHVEIDYKTFTFYDRDAALIFAEYALYFQSESYIINIRITKSQEKADATYLDNTSED
jgi:hypothetical protein